MANLRQEKQKKKLTLEGVELKKFASVSQKI